MATKTNSRPRPHGSHEARPVRYESSIVQSAYEAIRDAGGAVVVHFRKRTTGEERRMLCLFDEAEAQQRRWRYSHTEHSTLPVFDCEKGELRTVPLDSIDRIMQGGQRIWPKRERKSFEELQRQAQELF